MLEVSDLSAELTTPRGVIRTVDHVSFRLDRGQTLGIVGESGSGKSMLLRSTMGLLPAGTAELSGSVLLDSVELVGMKRRALRRMWGSKLAIVFQDPMTSLNPVVRIGRQITESIREAGDRPKTERALQLLESVGIPEPRRLLRQYPFELSGGMRQRVAIAISIAAHPDLLFADEPTTALDVTVQAQILDLLASLQRELRMALVLVSHDLGVIASRADTILVMYAGQVVEEAPAAALFDRTRSPYTEALIRSIPRTDAPSHTRLRMIGGRPPDLLAPPTGCRFAARCEYARDRCRAEEPPLIAAEDPAHRYRCWYPVGTNAADAPTVAVGASSAGEEI